MSRVLTFGLVLLALGGSCSVGAAATVKPVAAAQQTVRLLERHAVYTSPGGALVASVAATRPITHERTVLPVLASAIDNRVDPSGQLWLEVELPGRTLSGAAPPRHGWISAANAELGSTSWRLVVDLASRRLRVYDHGREVRDYRAIVGKPSTPTPLGSYFVEENVRLPAGAPGAPFALATSDRSAVLHEFEGGPGEIAIHGLEHLGGRLGTAASHGCIRIANSAITWLAARIAPGVPIAVIR